MEQYKKNSGNSDKELIIITGSSGLLGTNIINKLIDKYQLVGLDKFGNPYPPREVEWVCFDITSEKSIRTAMERVRYVYGNKITSVVHLAAYYDFFRRTQPTV
jgi:UDP-glucose 4-epimerase